MISSNLGDATRGPLEVSIYHGKSMISPSRLLVFSRTSTCHASARCASPSHPKTAHVPTLRPTRALAGCIKPTTSRSIDPATRWRYCCVRRGYPSFHCRPDDGVFFLPLPHKAAAAPPPPPHPPSPVSPPSSPQTNNRANEKQSCRKSTPLYTIQSPSISICTPTSRKPPNAPPPPTHRIGWPPAPTPRTTCRPQTLPRSQPRAKDRLPAACLLHRLRPHQ